MSVSESFVYPAINNDLEESCDWVRMNTHFIVRREGQPMPGLVLSNEWFCRDHGLPGTKWKFSFCFFFCLLFFCLDGRETLPIGDCTASCTVYTTSHGSIVNIDYVGDVEDNHILLEMLLLDQLVSGD